MAFIMPPRTPEECREDYADRIYRAAGLLKQIVEDMDLMAGTEWVSAVAEEEQETIRYIQEVGPGMDRALIRLCLRLKGYKIP